MTSFSDILRFTSSYLNISLRALVKFHFSESPRNRGEIACRIHRACKALGPSNGDSVLGGSEDFCRGLEASTPWEFAQRRRVWNLRFETIDCRLSDFVVTINWQILWCNRKSFMETAKNRLVCQDSKALHPRVVDKADLVIELHHGFTMDSTDRWWNFHLVLVLLRMEAYCVFCLFWKWAAKGQVMHAFVLICVELSLSFSTYRFNIDL